MTNSMCVPPLMWTETTYTHFNDRGSKHELTLLLKLLRGLVRRSLENTHFPIYTWLWVSPAENTRRPRSKQLGSPSRKFYANLRLSLSLYFGVSEVQSLIEVASLTT